MTSLPVQVMWSRDLERKELYYEGIVDGTVLDEVLEHHKRDTVLTFGTRSSCRRSQRRVYKSPTRKLRTEANKIKMWIQTTQYK